MPHKGFVYPEAASQHFPPFSPLRILGALQSHLLTQQEESEKQKKATFFLLPDVTICKGKT